jgi:hypothetical protein
LHPDLAALEVWVKRKQRIAAESSSEVLGTKKMIGGPYVAEDLEII